MTQLGFQPEWPAPARVGSFITYRQPGHSQGVYAQNNLASHVGDASAAVAANRDDLIQYLTLPQQPLWLRQVHGTRVVDAAEVNAPPIEADGAFCTAPGTICAVLTADCLPILLCDSKGTQVAAVHGGWRGLAKGIISAALQHFKGPRTDLLAYLGPAISASVYEVGEEVVAAFANLPGNIASCAQANSQRPGHYFLDLYAVAWLQLQDCGINAIYGGNRCSYREKSYFYSYRRDGQTGRMASLIWLKDK